MLIVEIEVFDALIENEPFLGQPEKSKQETYEELVEMSRNNDYTAGNLLDYLYHQNYYELTGIDLSRQVKTIIAQQMNFTGKLEGDGETIFLTSEKQQI